MKPVNKLKDLIGGQLYIRACVNCHGKTWLELHRYYGKPFHEKDTYNLTGVNKVSVKSLTRRFSARHNFFITDFTGNTGKLNDFSNKNLHFVRTIRLFKFSNDTYNRLKAVLNSRAELLAIINERKLSDKELREEINDWDYNCWYDGQPTSWREEIAIEKEWLTDHSVSDFIDWNK